MARKSRSGPDGALFPLARASEGEAYVRLLVAAEVLRLRYWGGDASAREGIQHIVAQALRAQP
jgi:hypothetical protein